MRDSRKTGALPPVLLAAAAALTALGLFAVGSDLGASELRARSRARELVRLTAASLSTELSAPRPPGGFEFALDAAARLKEPALPAPAEPDAPAEERLRVETFLDEAAYREHAAADRNAADRALTSAASAASSPSLRASVALARAAFSLRGGDATAARTALAPLLEAPPSLRTLRSTLPVRVAAALLAARVARAEGKEFDVGPLLESLDGVGLASCRALFAELAELGVSVPAESVARAEEAARRFDRLRLLDAAGAELLAGPDRTALGEILVLLAPRNAEGRRGVALDPDLFLAAALPRASELAQREGIPVAAASEAGSLDEEQIVAGSAGLLRLGLPRDFTPRDPQALPRAIALAALTALLGISVAAGAWVLARAARREIDAAQAKGDFLAGVTHELKTPLASIRLFGELLEEGSGIDAAKRRDYARTLRREAERLTSLVDRVLLLARNERGRADADETESVRAGELLRETAETFRPVAEREGFTLQVLHEAGDAALRVDPAAIVQALLDLLDNAVKYSGESRSILLRSARREATALLEVADRGGGLPAGDPEQLFEMFTRGGDALTRTRPGLGIGLALARRIVEANGGRLLARNREGGGSVFTIELPIG